MIIYSDDGVSSCDGEDVGAGHDLRAQRFDLGLDGVDDVEASNGVVVGRRSLLAHEGGGVVQQHRPVAPLQSTCMHACMQT